MPIPVACPGCAVRLNAPDAAAGKRVKCPKCQTPISVPAPEPDPQFEVVDEEPAPKPKPTPKPTAKAKAVAQVDDEEDELKPKKTAAKAVVEPEEDEDEPKPKKKAKAVAKDEEDEDEKPRKKKRRDEDDDDEDDRPRKKKKKGGAGGTSLARNVIGGVLLVILVCVAGFVFYDKLGKKDDDTASKTPANEDGPRSMGPMPGPKPTDGGPKDPGGQPPSAPKEKLSAAQTGGAVLTADGTRVLARHISGRGIRLSIWDAKTGEPVVSIGTGTSPQPDAYGLSPDKKQIAIVSHGEKKLTLWGIGGNLEKTINLPPWKDGTRIPPFATYTPDGKAVLTVYEKQLLRIDTQTGATQVLLKDVDSLSIQYVPEANAVVQSGYNSQSSKTELRVGNPDQLNAAKIMALRENEAPEGCPDLSADGKTVAVFVTDRTNFDKPTNAIHLYDATTGQLKSKISSPVIDSISDSRHVRISPDGRRVCFSGGVVKDRVRSDGCWVADVGGSVRPLVAPGKDSAQTTQFAADGKTIVVHVGSLRVYDTELAKDVTP